LVPGGDPVAGYARLLDAIMAEFRDFRFLYRDQRSYGEHGERVAAQAPNWIERTYLQFESHLGALAANGLLDWPQERLHDLAINSTIILRYGLDHYRELGEPTETGTGAVRRTLLRHLTLFEHRLEVGTAAQLRAAIEVIEAEALAA
ncbi:MAG: TetR/AcrR family transcriptional regulator, partial [Novosphingobium sp.]